MVAVFAANQAPDATLVSELGSLLLAHTRIRDPRWRLSAIVRRAPALRRFGVSLEPTRALIRQLGERAPCPAPMRALLVELLSTHLDAGFVDALWSADWKSCAQIAFDTARVDDAKRVVEIAAAGPRPRYAMPTVRRPSLVDVIACVDAGDADGAHRIARTLRPREQPYALAHLGRLALRVAPLREASLRAGAQLLVAREAIARDELDLARAFADDIERELIRQYAYVELARGLSRRGRIVEALRLLHRVTRPELVAERDFSRADISLMVRRDREGYRCVHDIPAWELPMWLRPRDWMSGEDRRQRYLAAALLRSGLRGDACAIPLAKGHLRRVSPRALFELLPRIGVDIDVALAALGGARDIDALAVLGGARNIDALRAERIAMRATALVHTHRELPDSMRLGLAGLATCDNTDGRSLERAWFDEGLALSTSAPRRRRVLIGVAQSALRSARSQSTEVIQTRLRTLVHLGGTLAADAIATPLAQLPVEAMPWLAALEALCALDAARAGDIVLARFSELRRAGIDPSRALEHVVAAGGMTADRAASFVGAVRMLDAVLGERAQRWLADFTRRWHARTGAPLDEVCLAWLRTCDLQRDPQSLLDELDEHTASLLGGDARDVAERLATDAQLLRAVLLDPPRVDRRMKSWSLEQWKSLLAKAATRSFTVDTSLVRRCAQLLRNPKATRALVRGDLSALGVPALTTIRVDNERLHLRVLDKRRDVLTYLRFADTPVRSCFRSDGWMYRSTELSTRREIIAAWRDPLTICIHVEHGNQPCGFVFGSFADIEGKPGLVFNSLHVRPNTPAVREPILRAIERSICAPLRIRWLGMSNWFNGEGHLPDDYIWGERTGIRFRALSSNDELVDTVDDDISLVVNTEHTFELYWRDLERNEPYRPDRLSK